MELGTAAAAPGTIARGQFAVTDLPTGGEERLPVVLANGAADGPTVWLTAAIHGDEVTALAAAQDAMAAIDPDTLAGRVVCLPTLNPDGLRRTSRHSSYHGEDPNRLFPEPERTDSRPPRVQELIASRVFDAMEDADALLDLHTAQHGSLPFCIRDRVLYGESRTEADARALAADLDGLARAVGLPVVTEYPAAEYTDRGLHRSTAGAALNTASIPALTLELGGPGTVEDCMVGVGVASVFRALVHLGASPELPPAVRRGDLPVSAPVEEPVRRYVGPTAERPGIVRHRVEPGDTVRNGDVVADVVTPAGEPLDAIESPHDGYVLARQEGVAVYENDPVASLAVVDDEPLVAPREE